MDTGTAIYLCILINATLQKVNIPSFNDGNPFDKVKKLGNKITTYKVILGFSVEVIVKPGAENTAVICNVYMNQVRVMLKSYKNHFKDYWVCNCFQNPVITMNKLQLINKFYKKFQHQIPKPKNCNPYL